MSALSSCSAAVLIACCLQITKFNDCIVVLILLIMLNYIRLTFDGNLLLHSKERTIWKICCFAFWNLFGLSWLLKKRGFGRVLWSGSGQVRIFI